MIFNSKLNEYIVGGIREDIKNYESETLIKKYYIRSIKIIIRTL